MIKFNDIWEQKLFSLLIVRGWKYHGGGENIVTIFSPRGEDIVGVKISSHTVTRGHWWAPKGERDAMYSRYLAVTFFKSTHNTLAVPTDTWRNNNVIITSKRRRFDVIMTLLWRRVPAGVARPRVRGMGYLWWAPSLIYHFTSIIV